MDRDFSEEDAQMSNEHMKKCSMSLIIRETKNQIHSEILFYMNVDECNNKADKCW